MDDDTVAAIKRQIPFLIGGTITGIIMTYFLGFIVTLLVNSALWYFISQVWYKIVWKKNGLEDQKLLLRYFLAKVRPQKNPHFSKPIE